MRVQRLDSGVNRLDGLTYWPPLGLLRRLPTALFTLDERSTPSTPGPINWPRSMRDFSASCVNVNRTHAKTELGHCYYLCVNQCDETEVLKLKSSVGTVGAA